MDNLKQYDGKILIGLTELYKLKWNSSYHVYDLYVNDSVMPICSRSRSEIDDYIRFGSYTIIEDVNSKPNYELWII